MNKINYILGNSYTDKRGTIRFVNEFTLPKVNRFYTIENKNTKIIRAWQGHEKETKYFSVIKGKFVVAWVEIDNFDNPSDNLKAEYKILDNTVPGVLHIPPGFANGLRALEEGSIIAVFSDFDVDRSVEEKRRYDPNMWFNWSQNFNENR